MAGIYILSQNVIGFRPTVFALFVNGCMLFSLFHCSYSAMQKYFYRTNPPIKFFIEGSSLSNPQTFRFFPAGLKLQAVPAPADPPCVSHFSPVRNASHSVSAGPQNP
jgi:hypothetical protein